LYNLALGELKLMPDEFWKLTNGELMAKIRGFVVRRDLRSSDHRNLFTLMANINREKGKTAKQPKEAWPLDIDYQDSMDHGTRLELYRKILQHGKAKT
jgi:hypothetical protein